MGDFIGETPELSMIEEYLEIFGERTSWLTAHFPERAELWLYHELSYALAAYDMTEDEDMRGRLKKLLKELPEELGAKLLDVNEEEYSGGVVLAHAGAVKGLEFDGVIIADADEESFADRDLDARLLYVCCTRALHRLMVCHSGTLSPLLQE